MTATDLIAVGELVGIVGGAAVGLGVLWKVSKVVWVRISNWFMSSVHSQIKAIAAEVTFIAKELRQNDGSSIRDGLNRTEKMLVSIQSNVWKANERQRARMDDDILMRFETDSEGNYSWVNRAYMRITGRTFKQLKGNGWLNVVAAENREVVRLGWQQAMAEGREFEMRLELQSESGSIFTVDMRSFKMTNPEGESLGYLGSISTVLNLDSTMLPI